MSRTVDESRTSRLENFIKLAKEGKKVNIEIELKNQLVKQGVYQEETDTMQEEIDMYLLTGDYKCSSQADIPTVSKIYMFAALDESATDAKTNRHIANKRLKMDYRRLRDAGITFEEKFF